MSQSTCNTVKIKVDPSEDNPAGVVTINESDFDSEVHTLVVEEEEKPVEPVQSAPATETQAGGTAAPWNVK